MERHPERPGGLVRRGFLIDFDHALNLERNRNSLSPGRCGTFQFFSAALLMDENLVQSGVDDRESCFHSIVYLALLHLKHCLSEKPVELHNTLQHYFESFHGPTKKRFTGRDYSGICWENQGLQEVVQELEEVFSWRYTRFNNVRDEKYAAVMRANQKAVLELLENRDWMHEALRKHANAMPEPIKKNKEFINNVHHPFNASMAQRKASRSQNTLNRLGLDGHLGEADADESEEPSPKRQKT
ncbi:hypothetical protein L218DRAFT_88937 [Marasmius fiardii PR-910]|nr:hypothetical protein L218DRAFT_88937 [Marasmius fiardii PR-910]